MRGNSVSIKGNATRNAEVRATQSGTQVVSFGIAWNRSRRNADGTYTDVPNYFDCTAFCTDRQAQFVVPSLVKGASVAVIDGHLQYETWTDQQDNKRSKVSIVVDDPINGLMVTPPQPARGAQVPAQPPVAVQPQPVPAPQAYAPQTAAYAPQGYQQPAPQQAYAPQVIQPEASIYDEEIPF